MNNKKYFDDLLKNLDGHIKKSSVTNKHLLLFETNVLKLYRAGYNYLEAVEETCDNNDIEYEDVNKFLSPKMKTLLTKEAEEKRNLKTFGTAKFKF